MAINPTVAALHAGALAADAAFAAELSRTYGAAACDARYDARGQATPHLRRLGAAKVSAYAAYRLAAFPHAREA